MKFTFTNFELTCHSHVDFKYMVIITQNLDELSITFSEISASKINPIRQGITIDYNYLWCI